MSVAIVAMVNHTALRDQDKHEELTNECGDEPNTTATAVVSRTISNGLNFIHNTGKFVENSVHVIDSPMFHSNQVRREQYISFYQCEQCFTSTVDC